MSSFEVGELILSSKPYAYIVNNTFRGEICDFCFKRQTGLKKCSGCSFLYYCDKECQAKAWKTHKPECKIILKAKPNEPTNTLRLIALILFKIKKYGYTEPCEDVFGRKVSFESLMSHAPEIEKTVTKCQEMIALINTLKDYIGQANIPLPSQFIEVFGKMCINVFSISDAEMQSIGCGLYLGASVFDHSCDPNAEVVFDGTNLSIRAVKQIPHRDLSKVYISYIDQLKLNEDRRASLKEQYYFTCQCMHCTSSHYDDLMTCLLVKKEEAADQLSQLKNKLEVLKQAKKDKVDPDVLHLTSIELLSEQEALLSDTHLDKIKALEIAFDACIYTERWSDALSIGMRLTQPYRLLYNHYHPNLGIHFFKIAKLQLIVDPPSASETLLEAADILKMTHGESHSLFQKELYTVPALNLSMKLQMYL